MLTREMIQTGAYLNSFKDLPQQPRWSHQRIEASMHETLAQRPRAQPVWLFAYGSLIWNPLFKYAEMQPSVLHGWHRSFCIRLHDGRGSVDAPGRMLALKAGGETNGVAFRLAEDGLVDELWLAWVREMVHGLYCPIWAEAVLADGRTAQALTFVADTTHQVYESDSSVATTVKAICKASGHLGSNRDYVLQLEACLADHDIQDAYVTELAAAVRTQSVGVTCS